MSLITIEGFEARSPRQGWTHSNQTTAGRFGGICSASGGVSYYLPTGVSEIRVGFAMQVKSSDYEGFFRIYPNDPTTNVYGVAFTITPSLAAAITRWNGSSSVRAIPMAISSGPIGSLNQWVYVEVGAKIASVGGYMEIKINGNTVVSFVGNTTSDARTVDPSYCNVAFLNWANTSYFPVDDIYVCDRLGSEFNDYIGDIQVEGLFPNGNGASSQFVGSDGNSVDNYMLVDEAPAVETDLVQSDVVGAKDTYAFTNLAIAGGVILAVQPTIYISKTNAGPAAAKIVERLSGGSERKSDPNYATNLGAFTSPVRTRDPDGAVWTVASVNAAEFGVEVA